MFIKRQKLIKGLAQRLSCQSFRLGLCSQCSQKWSKSNFLCICDIYHIFMIVKQCKMQCCLMQPRSYVVLNQIYLISDVFQSDCIFGHFIKNFIYSFYLNIFYYFNIMQIDKKKNRQKHGRPPPPFGGRR